MNGIQEASSSTIIVSTLKGKNKKALRIALDAFFVIYTKASKNCLQVKAMNAATFIWKKY